MASVEAVQAEQIIDRDPELFGEVDRTGQQRSGRYRFHIFQPVPFVLVFWSGIGPVLAVSGILLGLAARRTGDGPGKGAFAVGIGALALLGYVAIYVSDWMATNNIAGM